MGSKCLKMWHSIKDILSRSRLSELYLFVLACESSSQVFQTFKKKLLQAQKVSVQCLMPSYPKTNSDLFNLMDVTKI